MNVLLLNPNRTFALHGGHSPSVGLPLGLLYLASSLESHGIPMGCFFVIGFPGETRRQIRKTIRFALRLYARYNCMPKVGVATPLPGTELAQIAEQNGYLFRDLSPANLARGTSGSGSGFGMIRTPEFDPEYLHRCCAGFHHRRKLVRALFLLSHPAELRQFFHRRLFGVPPGPVQGAPHP